MRLFQVVVSALWIQLSWPFSISENQVIKSLIEKINPQHVLFATEKEVLWPFKSLLVPYQWIDVPELEIRGLGQVIVKCPTLVIVQSKIALSYFERLSQKSGWRLKSKNGPFHFSHVWVIIETGNDVELDLDSFTVAFNCEFYYVNSKFEIIEKYDFEVAHAKFLYGSWTSNDGLKTSDSDFYGRRMNTHGLTLRPSECEPLVCMQQEIWRGISAMMNISSKEAFFYQDVMTARSVSSISGTEFHTYLLEPPLLVGPIHTMRVYMHIKAVGKEAAGWQQFFKPFHANMWIAIGLFIIIATATSVVVSTLSTRRIEVEFFFAPLAAFCNQDGGNSNVLSVRLVLIATTITAMVVIPTYSAAVLSSIMITIEKLPFVNLEGLTQLDGYKIAGVYDKFSVDYMNMEIKYQHIVQNFFSRDLPRTLAEGLERLCFEDKFVFLGYNNFVVNEPELKCRVIKIPNYLFSSPLSFKLRDGSPFTKVFNRNLIKFYTSGLLEKLGKDADGTEPVDEDTFVHTAAVELVHVLFPIYVLAAGALISITVFVTEIISSCLCRRKIDAL